LGYLLLLGHRSMAVPPFLFINNLFTIYPLTKLRPCGIIVSEREVNYYGKISYEHSRTR
jgi:hypothetical protein